MGSVANFTLFPIVQTYIHKECITGSVFRRWCNFCFRSDSNSWILAVAVVILTNSGVYIKAGFPHHHLQWKTTDNKAMFPQTRITRHRFMIIIIIIVYYASKAATQYRVTYTRTPQKVKTLNHWHIMKIKRKSNTHPTYKNTRRKINILTEGIYQSFAKLHI